MTTPSQDPPDRSRRAFPQAATALDQRSLEQRLEALAREAPDSDPVVQRLTVVLHRASRAVSHVYRQALAESEVSLADYQVLRALILSGPPYALHPAELASECGQTQSTMTRRLELLEQRDLVRRTPDPSHRARVIVQLTPAGESSWREAQRCVTAAEEQAVSTLTRSDKRQLTALLTRVLDRS